MLYKEEIRFVLTDLDTNPDDIEFVWINRRFISRIDKHTIRVGQHWWYPFNRRSKIEVALKRGSYTDLITTLFHEVRHHWQYSTGLLFFDGKDYYWDGKKVPSKTPYHLLPEELDANNYTRELVKRFSGSGKLQFPTSKLQSSFAALL